jgi:CheY-like chemotaxis protein
LRPIEILIVEDNPADADLACEAFDMSRNDLRIRVVTDGARALRCVRQEAEYAHQAAPDLILLDLNIPKKDGRQVIKEIKEDPLLRQTPVIIVTSSRAIDDLRYAYTHGANAYIVKSIDVHEFMDAIRATQKFWTSAATLPSRDGQAEMSA